MNFWKTCVFYWTFYDLNMYSEIATPSTDIYVPQGPKPVFIQSRDVPSRNAQMYVTGEELYLALIKSVNRQCVTGIQRTGSLWRIYLNSHEARVKLISNGLMLRDTTIPVYDTNPYTKAKSEHLTRVVVKDIPLSVGDELIKSTLEKMKCQIRGDVIKQKLRVNGELIDCYNGDRVCYIDPPSQPLPRSIVVANLFRARVFHIGQPERISSCSRCLATGHHSSQCTNEVKCKRCNQSGHISTACSSDVNTATPTQLRNSPADRDTGAGAASNGSVTTNCTRDHTAGTETPRPSSAPQQQSDDVTTCNQKPRHQTPITDFLRNAGVTPQAAQTQSDEQRNSTDANETCETDDGSPTDSDTEFQSPLSPESPTPKKSRRKPPKRKRKGESSQGK